MGLLDDVMNQSMGEVEAAPEFVMPPNGRYLLNIEKAELEEFSWTDAKTQEEMSAVKCNITYSILEALELSDASAIPVPAGSLFSEGIGLEYKGTSPLKTFLGKIFGDEVGNYTFIEGVTALQNVQIEAVVRVKTNKGGFENARTSQQKPAGEEVAE